MDIFGPKMTSLGFHSHRITSKCMTSFHYFWLKNKIWASKDSKKVFFRSIDVSSTDFAFAMSWNSWNSINSQWFFIWHSAIFLFLVIWTWRASLAAYTRTLGIRLSILCFVQHCVQPFFVVCVMVCFWNNQIIFEFSGYGYCSNQFVELQFDGFSYLLPFLLFVVLFINKNKKMNWHACYCCRQGLYDAVSVIVIVVVTIVGLIALNASNIQAMLAKHTLKCIFFAVFSICELQTRKFRCKEIQNGKKFVYQSHIFKC